MRVLVVAGPVGTVPATASAQVVRAGWAEGTGDDVVALALSEGGTDVLDVVRATRGGALVATTVPDPLGRPVEASVLVVGATAYVEASQAVGPHLVREHEVRRAMTDGTSAGVGDLLALARARGAERIVVGLGAAAVRDGGAGALAALGLPAPALRAGAAGLVRLRAGDLDGLARLRASFAGLDLVGACADDAPFLGPRGVPGTTASSGPPAGDQADGGARLVAEISSALRDDGRGRALLPVLAAPVGRVPGAPSGHAPRTGAGGGVALAVEVLGGRLLAGAEVLADAVGVQDVATDADLVVAVAERLDGRALDAGVIGAAVRSGRYAGVPVVAVVARVAASRRELAEAGVSGAYAVLPEPGPFARVGPDARVDREQLGSLARRVARTWSGGR